MVGLTIKGTSSWMFVLPMAPLRLKEEIPILSGQDRAVERPGFEAEFPQRLFDYVDLGMPLSFSFMLFERSTRNILYSAVLSMMIEADTAPKERARRPGVFYELRIRIMSPKHIRRDRGAQATQLHVAKQSAQGSIVLFAGNLTATVGQTVASILIARLLGPGNYGIYSLALVIPSVFTLFVSLGVNTAVTRFVAYHLSRNEVEAAKRFAESALLLTLFSGILLSGVCYLSATALSQYVFHRPYLSQYVELASAIVCGQAILNTAIAAAIGWNAMGQASFANIAQAMVKLLLSPLLIVLGFGIFGAVAGQTLAAVLGAVISVGILYAYKIKSSTVGWEGLTSDTKEMMNYGLPAFSANVLTGLWPYYLSIVLAAVASNAVIGYYQAAYNFTVAISLLSGAAGSALFPAFTSLHRGEGEPSQSPQAGGEVRRVCHDTHGLCARGNGKAADGPVLRSFLLIGSEHPRVARALCSAGPARPHRLPVLLQRHRAHEADSDHGRVRRGCPFRRGAGVCDQPEPRRRRPDLRPSALESSSRVLSAFVSFTCSSLRGLISRPPSRLWRQR